jgi:glutathione peroxidase
VVIGFPSNSFGNENRSDAEIVQFCQAQYNANFLLASKGSVKGADMQPLYSWLAHQSENGVTDSEVKSDFQKYLIDTNGEILGLFAGSLSPLNQQVISAITGNYN